MTMTTEATEVKGLNEWAKDIHDNAIRHGWWDEPRSFGDVLALCHAELSEALEEYRDRRPMEYEEGGKPEGIAVEMMDTVIRILDWFASEDPSWKPSPSQRGSGHVQNVTHTMTGTSMLPSISVMKDCVSCP